jgi:hypothetical protein
MSAALRRSDQERIPAAAKAEPMRLCGHIMITPRKVLRAARAALPAWMLPVIAVALCIPGPQDELAVALIAGLLCAIQPVRARRAASAWRGGKSHRAITH